MEWSSTASLPAPLTSFVGREWETVVVRDLLRRDDVRLVTLSGPGGVGKTRLALRVATDIAADFPHGIWFVPLAPIQDPGLIPAAIARVARVREATEGTLLDGIVAAFRDKRALLILDSFEHLLEAAPLVTDLLAACRHLKCLVTSTALLRLSGEHDFTVPLMALPDPEATSVAQMEHVAAVRLFVTRARSVRPAFALTDANAADIAAICRELDGLPLAIELAAACIRHLSPAALRAHLTGLTGRTPLELLTGGPRDAPARQRTLRDTIAWSYRLLSPEEQWAFRHLAVFEGGFTLDLAEAVMGRQGSAAGGQGEVEGGDGDRSAGRAGLARSVFDVVAALVDSSLVTQRQMPNGDLRYGMLETVRGYGAALLADAGEDATVRQRHADAYLDLAESNALAPFLPDGHDLLERLQDEQANLRAALDWFETTGQPEKHLRLASSLYFFWVISGFLSELKGWLERGLAAHGAEISPAVQARAWWALGGVARLLGESARAERLLTDALERFRALGDPARTALALQGLGHVWLRRGEHARARACQEEAIGILTGLDDPWAQRAASTGLTHLGNIAVAQGALAEAEAYFRRAIDLQHALGHEPGTSHAYASHPLAGMGDVARAKGENAAALAWYQRALRHAWTFREVREVAYALGGIAATLAAAGQWDRAAGLFGAAERLHQDAGLDFETETMDRQRALGLPEPWQGPPAAIRAHQPLQAALPRRTLPAVPDLPAAASAWARGRTLRPHDAIADALGAALGDEEPAAEGTPAAFGLTQRELEVLPLLARGLSDREIGDALYISPRTASKHVANILAKVGVATRAEAAVLAVRHGLVR